MPSIDDLLSNPGSSSIYLNHRFFYAIGNTPSVDLTEGCQVPTHAQFLLLGCGDIRNILQTVHEVSQLQSKPKSLTFHLNDIDDVLLARNAVLLRIVNTIDPCKREDVEFLWNVWYDLHLSEDNLQRLKSVLTSILENPLENLTFESQECSTAVKTVLKQWLKLKMDIRDTLSHRERFICQRIEALTNTSVTFLDAVNRLYSNVQICRALVMREHSEEMKTYFRTGSTDSESAGFTNPTFICPHINGYRVHPEGLPYFAFKKHAYMFEDKLSLRDNCILQLQLQLKSWNMYSKIEAIKVSLWDGDALTLCYRRMPDSMNFNFINASNLCDHISLLNVLLACSKRLKRKGVLTVQTMHLLKKGYGGSLEKYLAAELAIPPSLFPTFLGLHLAEDFELGTSDTSAGTLSLALHEVSTRWIAIEHCTPDISYEESPEVEAVFARLAKSCFSLFDPKSQTDHLNVPLTLIYLMRQLAKHFDNGVKPLLDTAEKCLPTETTQSGQHFRPLEMEWNMLTRYFFGDEQSSAVNEELVELHVPVQKKRNIFMPALFKIPAGLDAVNRAVLTQDFSDSINFTKKTYQRSWRVITVLDFNYKTNILTCVLSRSSLSLLGKDTYLQLLFPEGHPSTLFTTGPVVSIMSCGSSISMKDNREAAGRSQKRRKSQASGVNLTVRETSNDYRITIKSTSIDRTIQMFEYCVDEKTSNNIQLTYKLRKDIKDPEETPVSAEIDVKVPCPVEPTESIRCYITNTVSISKSRHLVQGQILLPSRRMDISMYPRWSSNKDVFYRVVGSMFSVEDDLRRKASQQDAEDIGNTSFKVKETLQVMLTDAFCPPTRMPLVRAYRLNRDERKKEQQFGFFPDDIFIGVRGLYNVRGTPTLDIVWLDFEIYRNQAPYLYGMFSEEARRFLSENGGSVESAGKTLHMFFISKQEAILLKKLLRFNSRRSIQKVDNCGSPKWGFNAFLQPLFSITQDFDHIQNLTGKNFGQVMDYYAKIKEEADIQKEVATQTLEKCGSCGLPKPDMKKCSRCKKVVYCSKECQLEDWKAGHKHVCVRS